MQVLLDYGEYNEQGDVSYTIANLEGSILFILGLDVPVHARSAYESCAFALANPAFIASNRHGRNGSMSRDIKSKYSSDALSEMSHATTATTGYNDSGGMQNNSSSTPAFTEMSFAVKGKGEHTEEDVVAMKQLGKLASCLHVCCAFQLQLQLHLMIPRIHLTRILILTNVDKYPCFG